MQLALVLMINCCSYYTNVGISLITPLLLCYCQQIITFWYKYLCRESENIIKKKECLAPGTIFGTCPRKMVLI